MKKRYILQKDTPELKAGAVFEWNAFQLVYMSHDEDRLDNFYNAKHVENNPEWFLPVEIAESGKWIPVMERNPIAPDDYIVTFENGQVASNRFNSDWWYPGTIAWQPKPKPYQP